MLGALLGVKELAFCERLRLSEHGTPPIIEA